LAPDDRTGLLYDVGGPEPIPWVYLPVSATDGSPMKAEWASVKGDKLYIGGNGKEFCFKRTKPPKFDWIDHNEDEALDRAEMGYYDQRLKNSLVLLPVERSDVFKAMDKDANGKIKYEEFTEFIEVSERHDNLY